MFMRSVSIYVQNSSPPFLSTCVLSIEKHRTLDSRGPPFWLPCLRVVLSQINAKKDVEEVECTQLNERMGVGDKIGTYSSLRHSFRDTAIAH